MSTNAVNFNVRIDKDVKEEAEKLFSELGMTLTGAFNVFLRQSIRERKIPFEISLKKPNKETIEAMKEGEKLIEDKTSKSYKNIDEMWHDLELDVC